MPDNSEELREAGKLLYPLFREYVAVEAIYHRGEDLIFKSIPKIPLEDFKDKLSRQAFEAGFYLTFFQDKESLFIVAKDIRPQKTKVPWLNILLFVLTLASMIIAYGYIKFESEIFRDFSLMAEGIKFALALMPILLFHEFGHYLAARRNKANVSLPYFIPAPTLIGTLGAVIKSRSPFKTRRELFDVGAAGPLAGFVPAVIILAIGFSHAEIINIGDQPLGTGHLLMGQSLIYFLLKVLIVPPIPEGYTLIMSPTIFAGWVGLFVTMINLMPVGQLDGGHITYALFGRKPQFYLAWIIVAGLVVMGFFWPGWFVWAFLAVVIIKLKHPPTMNDKVKLDRKRMILGWISIALFILTFIPIPLKFVIVQ
jgi:membrane-associated protease RseP (regulator of RpoE activity)